MAAQAGNAPAVRMPVLLQLGASLTATCTVSAECPREGAGGRCGAQARREWTSVSCALSCLQRGRTPLDCAQDHPEAARLLRDAATAAQASAAEAAAAQANSVRPPFARRCATERMLRRVCWAMSALGLSGVRLSSTTGRSAPHATLQHTRPSEGKEAAVEEARSDDTWVPPDQVSRSAHALLNAGGAAHHAHWQPLGVCARTQKRRALLLLFPALRPFTPDPSVGPGAGAAGVEQEEPRAPQSTIFDAARAGDLELLHQALVQGWDKDAVDEVRVHWESKGPGRVAWAAPQQPARVGGGLAMARRRARARCTWRLSAWTCQWCGRCSRWGPPSRHSSR